MNAICIVNRLLEADDDLDSPEEVSAAMLGDNPVDDAYAAYEYARHTLNGPFPAGEAAIKQSSELTFLYDKYVLKRRWPEGEPAIMQDPIVALWYAHDIIQDRWPEAEEMLLKSIVRKQYQNFVRQL